MRRLLRWDYLLVLATAVFLAMLIAGTLLIHFDWQAHHKNFMRTFPRVNWVAIELKSTILEARNAIMPRGSDGLPIVSLFVPVRAQETLLSEPLESTKNWQRGYRMNAKGDLERIKVRHRGDNPRNWAFPKKSWRIKTSKKRLIDEQRVFNYMVSDRPDLITEYLGMWAANRSGLLVPRTRMVELFINSEPHGIVVEYEHMDESFLRNRHIMPVHLYKGEQINAERSLGVGTGLFANAALWSKLSNNNQYPENDRSDLSSFISTLADANYVPDAMRRLKRIAPIDEWARLEAFVVMLGNAYYNEFHNQRLLVDSWRGVVLPVVSQDAMVGNGRELDMAGDPLLQLYHSDSEFLLKKHEILVSFVIEQDILGEMIAHAKSLRPAMARSAARDIGLIEPEYWDDFPLIWPDDGVMAAIEQRIANLEARRSWLQSALRSFPVATWDQDAHAFYLTITNSLPIAEVSMRMVGGTRTPSRIAVDINGNGLLDDADLNVPMKIAQVDGGEALILQAAWFANRRNINTDVLQGSLAFKKTTEAVVTSFKLVSDVPFKVSHVSAKSAVMGETKVLQHSDARGSSPTRYNVPTFAKSSNALTVWSGEKVIQETEIVFDDVRILAGTRVRLAEGANLIFRGKVEVAGTSERRVSFERVDAAKAWGVLALQGHGTRGSMLRHFEVRGGSGGRVDDISYTGMFSIQDTADVTVEYATLSEASSDFDDMMHIIYGEGIVLRKLKLIGAPFDALDIDISKVRIDDAVFDKSGNDGLDFMDSRAVVKNSRMTSSGDKGASVGEGSNVLLINNWIAGNTIGIESKDGSVAMVFGGEFDGNLKTLNAYKKNWRYGGGGTVLIDNAKTPPSGITVGADKNSRVVIGDISGKVQTDDKKRVTHTPSGLAEEDRKWISDTLKSWGLTDEKMLPRVGS